MSTTLAVALIALGGVVLSQVVLVAMGWRERAADRRVELLRNIRWAAELALKDDEASADMGLNVLDSIRSQYSLSAADEAMITAILMAVVDDEVEAYTEGTEYVYSPRDSSLNYPDDIGGAE